MSLKERVSSAWPTICLFTLSLILFLLSLLITEESTMRAHSPLFVSESSQSLHSLSRLCRRALSQTCLRLALITTLVGGCAVDDTLQVSGCLPGEVVERTCERCLCGADGELEGCEEIACDGVLSKELPPPLRREISVFGRAIKPSSQS